jgi:hypothetical protein
VQNVHLVARWLPTLEKKLEQYALESHPSYRVFISAEPASTRDTHIIPQGILESAIKITNEPPTGMMANLHKAFDNFNQVNHRPNCILENNFVAVLCQSKAYGRFLSSADPLLKGGFLAHFLRRGKSAIGSCGKNVNIKSYAWVFPVLLRQHVNFQWNELKHAVCFIQQDTLEMCAREAEFKSILFSLCYFHAVVCERRKFGPQGWNRSYPFNVGDLTISVNVLYNYLEANSKVPWEDLRYLFGEIMYGGHITDDWDRRLCRTYLEEYMNPSMVNIIVNFI